jgi:hypothetical protein
MSTGEVRRELIRVAKAMLAGEMHLVLGAREIDRLYLDLGLNDPLFHGIRGFASETEDFVPGHLRENWSSEYLQRVDAEVARFLLVAEPDLRRDLLAIIARYDADGVM